jgi:tRNA(Ile)-lysidine synthase TilS/MesJ
MAGPWTKSSNASGRKIIVPRHVGETDSGTYCGVFRRQALDRGSTHLGINHILTGHNADDMAETVIMNRAPSTPAASLI